MRVLLPALFGPMTASTSPGCRKKLAPSRSQRSATRYPRSCASSTAYLPLITHHQKHEVRASYKGGDHAHGPAEGPTCVEFLARIQEGLVPQVVSYGGQSQGVDFGDIRDCRKSPLYLKGGLYT